MTLHARKAIISWGHEASKCSLPACSENEFKHLFVLCGRRCFYCAEFLCVCKDQRCPRKRTMDHLIPVFRSGCNCVENVVPACALCNSMKKGLTVQEFLASRPAFVRNTGKFYTSNISLRANPLESTIRRLAEKKRMPRADRVLRKQL